MTGGLTGVADRLVLDSGDARLTIDPGAGGRFASLVVARVR